MNILQKHSIDYVCIRRETLIPSLIEFRRFCPSFNAFCLQCEVIESFAGASRRRQIGKSFGCSCAGNWCEECVWGFAGCSQRQQSYNRGRHSLSSRLQTGQNASSCSSACKLDTSIEGENKALEGWTQFSVACSNWKECILNPWIPVPDAKNWFLPWQGHLHQKPVSSRSAWGH